MGERAKPHKRILYGRRVGHKLSDARQALVDQLLPHLRIDLPAPPADNGDAAFLDIPELFAGMPATTAAAAADLWLEIGFGSGEHLAACAAARPDVAIIGCEPFLNGVASLLRYIERDGLQNVRIWQEDARVVLAALPAASVAKTFLLYPDPWPKARHAKRRFVTQENLDHLARVLADGAELLVATDHPVYCRWALSQILRHGEFEWTATRSGDWKTPPADWPGARYEAKAIRAGRKPHYLLFRRKPRLN